MKISFLTLILLTSLNLLCQDTLFYPNGNLKQIGNQQNGKYEFFGENGLPILKGNYLNGKENGEWQTFNVWNGNLGAKYFMLNGKVVGEYIGYHPSGAISAKYTLDTNGVLLGQYYSYYESGKILKNRYNSNGMEVSTSYYESGQIITRDTIIYGLLEGIAVMYYENGNLHHLVNKYKQGIIEGDYYQYYENGILKGKETTVTNGRRWNAYDEKGTLLSESVEQNDSLGYYVVQTLHYYGSGKVKRKEVTKSDTLGHLLLDNLVYYENGIVAMTCQETEKLREKCLHFDKIGKKISEEAYKKINGEK